MKLFKIVFSLFLLISFAQTSSGQTAERRLLGCVTVSCCSIGPITIEIWSQKTCHYITVNRATQEESKNYSISFTSPQSLDQQTITVYEDVLLAGMYNEAGEILVLPKGDYVITNNQIDFTPTALRAIEICYERVVSGTIFGHPYNSTLRICIVIPQFILLRSTSNTKGVIEVATNFTEEQKEWLRSSNNEIYISEDVAIQEDGVNYTLKQGKYIVNDDSKIYLQNQLIN